MIRSEFENVSCMGDLIHSLDVLRILIYTFGMTLAPRWRAFLYTLPTLETFASQPPKLYRQAVRSGQHLVPNWSNVCRSQTAVNFDIRALRLLRVSRLWVTWY
jgi:hypothetical protein